MLDGALLLGRARGDPAARREHDRVDVSHVQGAVGAARHTGVTWRSHGGHMEVTWRSHGGHME
eukprot:1449695-Prymnesium_polylepis.1